MNRRRQNNYSQQPRVGSQFPSAPVPGDGNCYIRDNGRIVGIQQVSQPNFWQSLEREQVSQPNFWQSPERESIPAVMVNPIQSVESINLSDIMTSNNSNNTDNSDHTDEFIDKIPDEFLCPITKNIMSDPVICQDGYTYERLAIMSINNSLSPMTR